MSRPNDNHDEPPHEEPPPYTEVAADGNVSVDEGAGTQTIRRFDVQTNRPETSSASIASTHTGESIRPSGRPSVPIPEHTPPAGPPPSHSHRPPAGPPPNRHNSEKIRPSEKTRPSEHHDDHFHAPHPQSPYYQPPPSHPPPSQPYQHPPPHPQPPYPPQAPPPGNPQLRYPRGYFCKKCHNTGIKVYKGTTCQDCFERFGVRSQAQYLPPGAMPIFNMPPRVVQPGDPSIGGWLCGRCRGAGVIRDFLFESQCPICHGVGRVF